MLASLRTIVQEVNSARSLPEVLAIIVKEVRGAMNAGVCSVYLFDTRTSAMSSWLQRGCAKNRLAK